MITFAQGSAFWILTKDTCLKWTLSFALQNKKPTKCWTEHFWLEFAHSIRYSWPEPIRSFTVPTENLLWIIVQINCTNFVETVIIIACNNFFIYPALLQRNDIIDNTFKSVRIDLMCFRLSDDALGTVIKPDLKLLNFVPSQRIKTWYWLWSRASLTITPGA